jgi:hypothetical protein
LSLLGGSSRPGVSSGKILPAQRSTVPAAIWLFHFLEIGEALPELVGEADWRPASRAMLRERLRVRRGAGYRLHISSVERVCCIVVGLCLVEARPPAQG